MKSTPVDTKNMEPATQNNCNSNNKTNNKTNKKTNIKQQAPSFKKLFFGTIFGSILIAILYQYMAKGEDLRFTQAFYQVLGHNAGATICKYIGYFFSSKLWIGLMILTALLGAFGYKKQPETRKNMFFFSLSLFISVCVVSALKIIIGRYRPYAYFEGISSATYHHFCFKNDACHSAPSSHSALAFSALFCFSRIINKKSIALFCALLAVAIAFSRIVTLNHYLSDIIFGGYIGLLSVYWSQWILKIKKNN